MTFKKIVFPNIINDKNILYKDVELQSYHILCDEVDRKVLLLDFQNDNRQRIEKIINLIKGNVTYTSYVEDKDYKILSESADIDTEKSIKNFLSRDTINLQEVINSIDAGNNLSKIWFSKYLISNDEVDKVINIYNSYISLENNEQIDEREFVKDIKLRYKDIQKLKNEETDRFFVNPIDNDILKKMEHFIKEEIENKN